MRPSLSLPVSGLVTGKARSAMRICADFTSSPQSSTAGHKIGAWAAETESSHVCNVLACLMVEIHEQSLDYNLTMCGGVIRKGDIVIWSTWSFGFYTNQAHDLKSGFKLQNFHRSDFQAIGPFGQSAGDLLEHVD